MKQLMLMIGTRKGAFLAFSDPSRATWKTTGPIFKGVQVDHVAYAPGVGGAIVVAGTSAWWGPGLPISTDLGKTWQERAGIRFAEDRGHSVERVWTTAQGPVRQAKQSSTPVSRRRRCFVAVTAAKPGRRSGR